MEGISWRLLVWITRWWGERYLDQWDKFKFMTKCGTVYVTIERESQWPNSFNAIDRSGHPVRQ